MRIPDGDRVKFDLEEFDICLRKLAQKMEEQDIEPVDLYAVGGYICLRHNIREYSHDIDAYYDNMPPSFDKCVAEVSREVGNCEWLNNKVQQFVESGMSDAPSLEELLSIPQSFEEVIYYGKRVRVHLASPSCVIFLKAISNREEDKTDLTDIADLADMFGLETILGNLHEYRSIYHSSILSFDDLIGNILLAMYQHKRINNEKFEELYREYVMEDAA